MKSILLFASLSLSVFAKSQTNVYYPIPDSAAVWYEEGVFLVSSTPLDLDYFKQSYSTGNDTMIGSYTYTKIHRNYYEYAIYMNIGQGVYNYTLYLLRQDTATRRVYLYRNGSDTLLYDYSLSVGDTVPASYKIRDWNPSMIITITAIDSVLVGGNYHKRLNTNIGFLKYIEGVGSNQGFIPVMLDFEAGDNDIMCFSVNGIFQYSNLNWSGPCLPLSQNEITTNDFVSVYPNPSSGIFNINFGDAYLQISEIEIYNSLGEKIFFSPVTNNLTSINLSSQPKGIYFLLAKTDAGIVSCKVIVE